jgi:hypothetical protein
MTDIMIAYAVTLVWGSITIGVCYKLIALGARKSSLLMAPVLPIVALLFKIRFTYKTLKKNNCKHMAREIVVITLYSVRDISILTGIVCGVIASYKIGISSTVASLFKRGPHFFSNKIKKEYKRYERNVFAFSE